jgi:hypothetical protein
MAFLWNDKKTCLLVGKTDSAKFYKFGMKIPEHKLESGRLDFFLDNGQVIEGPPPKPPKKVVTGPKPKKGGK